MHQQQVSELAKPPSPEEQLRGSWQFAAACQFIFSFGLDLGLSVDLTTETLEAALSGDHSELIVEVFVRLLRVCTANRFINNQTWVEYLKREFLRRDLDLMPFPDEMLYYQPPPPSQPPSSDKAVKEESKDGITDGEASSSESPKHHTISNGHAYSAHDTSPSSMEDTEEQQSVKKEEDDEGSGDANADLPPVVPLRLQPEDFWKLSPSDRAICLYVACEWQLDDPERFRRMMKVDTDAEHWRVDPVGFDARGGVYYLFDDNRLFVFQPPPPPTPPRKTSASGKRKRKSGGGRRRRVSSRRAASAPSAEREMDGDEAGEEEGEEEKTILSSPRETWTLVARTLEDWEAIESLLPPASKDADEQYLRQTLIEDISPKVLEDLRAQAKEQAIQEALLFRKRSSRLIRKEEEERERVMHTRERRSMRVQASRIQQEEEGRQERALSRERRAQRREARVAQQRLEPNGSSASLMADEEMANRGRPRRRSQRAAQSGGSTVIYGDHNASRREGEEEESWEFDCVCGKHGRNYDDGEEMVACERCEVWQHVGCVRALDEGTAKDAEAKGTEVNGADPNGTRPGDAAQSDKGMDWSSFSYYCPRCREVRRSQSQSGNDEDYDPSLDLINVEDDMSDDDGSRVVRKEEQSEQDDVDVDVDMDVDVDVGDNRDAFPSSETQASIIPEEKAKGEEARIIENPSLVPRMPTPTLFTKESLTPFLAHSTPIKSEEKPAEGNKARDGGRAEELMREKKSDEKEEQADEGASSVSLVTGRVKAEGDEYPPLPQ
ncbi:hypothetical protein BJ684DRAFT_17373 [Piptocephalis cylindrospora]|uniref:Zinc finger PHD-type domain-containing protein n=1 Tax=Piptocephalis cylindrospora TaxID=1907219 RepID=A0A4P9Y0C4_9FUNG|nr:hypothetical protein BJ684DRAFT_17373 [Piptocephalis cylindrospora]|eukprot:RKP12104.1 hypothetical protein BJ684DRAFT_17373 [Piptocephalis cylindrospora]